MDQVKLRNKQAEDRYFNLLSRWQEATSAWNIDQYSEASLKFLFESLERAWKDIGYVIGDRDSKTKEVHQFEMLDIRF